MAETQKPQTKAQLMSEKRTKLSNWVYRLILGLLIIGACRYGREMMSQFGDSNQGLTGGTYWSVTLSLLSGAISLGVAALAMALRSGAVVWLLGLQLILMVSTVLPAMLGAGSAGLLIGVALLLVVVVGLAAAIFIYLIRRGEIRRP